MRYFIFFLILLPLYLHSACLHIGVGTTVASCSGDSKKISIVSNLMFDRTYEVSDAPHTKEIPLYISSDSNESIDMQLSFITQLLHNNGTSIQLTPYYKYDATQNQITDGNFFELLGTNEKITQRDGNTIIGYLKFVTSSISADQTSGDYVFSTLVTSRLGSENTTSKRVTIKAFVSLVAVIGFESANSYKSGKRFVTGEVNYGTFLFNQKNIIEKDLFIKSNSSLSLKLKFETTPPLIHSTNSNTQINMNYYWNENSISANQNFIQINQKNSGTNSYGKLKFETQAITSAILAGTYKASIPVTITLE